MNTDRSEEKIASLWDELDDRLRVAFRRVDAERLPFQSDGQVYLDFFGVDEKGKLSVEFFIIVRASVEDEDLDSFSAADLRPIRTLARRIGELSAARHSSINN